MKTLAYDCPFKGQQMNPLIFDILLRYRTYPVALTSQNEKRLLQVSTEPLTIFWYDDVFCDFTKLKRLRFSKVIFGVTSSPICRKNWKLFSCRHRSSPSEVFLRKGALKICSKFKEYTYAEVRFHFGVGVLLQIFRIFSEHLFLRTPLKGCFCTQFLWRRHLLWNGYWIIQRSAS